MAIESKAYNPENVESRWYQQWLDSGCFKGKAESSNEAYSIVIPPPNVTGVLTMGHVLNNTIQDVLTRNARQSGLNTLWLPGTDHAGIATQTRVEKELRKEGKTRYDLGREAFYNKVVEWRDTHGGIILKQLQSLGASCDWDRTVHTLDDDYSKAVLTAFIKLFERGYIYRGKRMVNWCPASLTALSDEEVIMKPQKGILYKMKYEVVEKPGTFIEISTTRPETIMGDTAVAVHPEDPRYTDLIGKHVYRPFPKAELPIIVDKAVEKDFGTGALKVTPAHDMLDFEIGQRHNLEVIDVFHPDGRLNELAGDPFVGMDRFEARKVAANMLEEMGLLIEREDYENNVGYSERADVPIEPRLSEQWFLKYPKVEEAKAAVREGIIRFYPERWEKTYLHWLENIQDWCISRQLWWGHRIPVWYKKGKDRSDSNNWHISLEGPSDPENWEQDDDVLDTWASSWLWPFATMGWPDAEAEKQQGLHTFYPTSALVTGPDIIFFWVARMIMAGLEFMGPEKKTLSLDEIKDRIPFKDVYFTGIIRDIQGRKMSKSLGNSPDPLDLIAKYGADGLRFAILNIAPIGQDIRFSEESVEQGRNFCNKIWNACRFRQMQGDFKNNHSLGTIISRIDPAKMDRVDHAMISSVLDATESIQKSIGNYQFTQCTQKLYSFFWNDFCDWYVEASKSKLQNPEQRETCIAIQDLVIRQFLLLLHPFCPFISEELWHLMEYGDEDSFITECYPEESNDLIKILEKKGINVKEFQDGSTNDLLKEIISSIRATKARYNLNSDTSITADFIPSGDLGYIVEDYQKIIENLTGLKSIEVIKSYSSNFNEMRPKTLVVSLGRFYLNSSQFDLDKEIERIDQEILKVEKNIKGIESKLNNPGFRNKAPEKVVKGAEIQKLQNENKRDELIAMKDDLTEVL